MPIGPLKSMINFQQNIGSPRLIPQSSQTHKFCLINYQIPTMSIFFFQEKISNFYWGRFLPSKETPLFIEHKLYNITLFGYPFLLIKYINEKYHLELFKHMLTYLFD